MPALRDRGEQDTYKPQPNQFPAQHYEQKYVELTFETDMVALQTVHGLSEVVFSSGGHYGGIDVFLLTHLRPHTW